MKKCFIIIFILFSSYLYPQSPVELEPIIEVRDKEGDTRLGEFTRGVGDINKDGYDDVVVSAPVPRLSYLYYGGNPMDTVAAKIFNAGGRITFGDFNGDAWKDIAIEKYFRDTVFVYYGSLDTDTIPDLILHAENNSIEGYGFSLRAGDLDSDGFDDLILSASGYTDNSDSTYRQGKLYIYKSSTKGLDTLPVWTATRRYSINVLGLGFSHWGYK